MRVSGLEEDWGRAKAADRVLSDNWDIVEEWSEQSRYERVSRTLALELFRAVTDPDHGVLPWLKRHW
jgi:hypothetical protein